MAVLDRIPGLLDAIPALPFDNVEFYSVLPEDKGLIATIQAGGQGPRSIRRSDLTRSLIEFAQKLGVEVKWSHHLESLEQTDDSVSVKFANGVQETFSFVVGCDGLHSATRRSLFGKQSAMYTGVSQVSRFSLRVRR